MAILQLHTIPKGLYFSYSEVFVLLFALSTHQRVFISTMYPLKSINRFQHQRISQHLTLFFKYGHLLSPPPHTHTHKKNPRLKQYVNLTLLPPTYRGRAVQAFCYVLMSTHLQLVLTCLVLFLPREITCQLACQCCSLPPCWRKTHAQNQQD